MTSERRFAALDGLRGLAAAGVMLRHLNEEFRLPQFVGHGYLAVDFFFVLSGFVIAWAYEGRLAAGWPGTQFLRVRLIRLLPLIALGSMIGGFVAGVEGRSAEHVIVAVMLSILVLPLPWGGFLFPINSVLWSMTYELFGNGLYVWARPHLGTRALVAATGVAALAMIAIGVTVGDLDTGYATHLWWSGAPRLAFPFLAGILIYRVHVRPPKSAPSSAGLSWLLVAAMVAVMVTPEASGRGGAAFDIVCSLVVFPALVWFGLRATVTPRLAAICVFAGELSYPLYVIHKPLENAMAVLTARLPGPERGMAAFGCVVVVVVMSSLASRRYDAPVRRLLTRLTESRPNANRSAQGRGASGEARLAP